MAQATNYNSPEMAELKEKMKQGGRERGGGSVRGGRGGGGWSRGLCDRSGIKDRPSGIKY